MNLKFCLFSFYFLFQFYLNEGIFDVLVNSIEDKGFKQYLKDKFEELERKLNILEQKIESKSLEGNLNLSAKKLCKELSEMMVENNWDNLNNLNSLSKVLTDGELFLKEICKENPEACFDYEDKYYNNALNSIPNNWNKIFPIILNFWNHWNGKINTFPQNFDFQNHAHRRSKRGYYRYNKDDEEERERKHNEMVNKFHRDVEDARNYVCKAYIAINIIMFIVVYLYATQIYPSLH
ncbi:unnamed protein product [Meloidogyne enterolobii]|uniref:Uncharacterized protein n=1 Tax=Meloidogyne enterolobii TaxID=390850 RepID=A0ACB0XV02_MELEN